MNINPKAQTVLCFGDSLTWGHFHSGIRFEQGDRWTYMLQEIIGNDFNVVEEGLRSRTTNLDDTDSLDRNGLPYFRACVESNDPVHTLVYMLGTNDTKKKFNRSVDLILSGVKETLVWLKDFNNKREVVTKIILIAPPQINTEFLKTESSFDSSSNEKLITFAKGLCQIAVENGYDFLDLSEKLKGAENDGIHLAVEDNRKIAELLAGYFK